MKRAPQSARYEARLWEDWLYSKGEGAHVVRQLRELVCDSIRNVVACGRSGVCSQNNSTVERHSHDRSLRDTSLSIIHASFDRQAFQHRHFKFLHRESGTEFIGRCTHAHGHLALSELCLEGFCVHPEVLHLFLCF